MKPLHLIAAVLFFVLVGFMAGYYTAMKPEGAVPAYVEASLIRSRAKAEAVMKGWKDRE